MTLLREGSSVPFIARYRKERTKGLDEEQIRQIEEAYQYQTHLEKRKEDVLRLIDQQGMLDEALREAICACEKLSQVEDLYRPYQQKRKTRATMAIAKGLRPLAEWMLRLPAKGDLRREAAAFVGEQVKDETEAIAGAKDIIAEMVSDDARVREVIRTSMQKYGRIVTKAKKQHTDERHIYQMYYDHSERIDRVQPHRIMAIDRGEKEKVLQVSISFNEAYVEQWVLRRFLKNRATCVQEELTAAIRDGLSRLAIPSVEREVRAALSERAQEASIDVFSMNVERLLTQPPIKDRWVLGFDPAFRTGCKLAVIDPMGTLKEISVIYPHPPKARGQRSTTGTAAAVTHVSDHDHRHRQRDGFPGERSLRRSSHPQRKAVRELCPGERGRRQRVFGQSAGQKGVSGAAGRTAFRHFHRPSDRRSAGRADQDRSTVVGGRAVSA